MVRTPLVIAILGLSAALACAPAADTIAPAAAATVPAAEPAPARGKAAAPAPAKKRHDIVVTNRGFEPDKLKVKKGEATTLSFTRKTESQCAKEVVVQLGNGQTIHKELPLDQPVVIEATFATSGELRYACGMDMLTGVISVE